MRTACLGAKQELLDRWRQGCDHPTADGSMPRSIPGAAPLSFSQERLWFLDRLVPGDPFYNLPVALRIRGPLNMAALASSITDVVRRHEVLRTALLSDGGEPFQVIGPPRPFPVPLVDLVSLASSEKEDEVKKLLAEDVRRPFSLSQGHLLRVRVIRLQESENVLALTMHHIVSDGWSIGVVSGVGDAVRGVSRRPAVAAGAAAGAVHRLRRPGSGAGWQAATLERLLGYWRRRLQGASVLELPTDRPRPPLPSFRGATHRLVIEGEVYAGLRS